MLALGLNLLTGYTGQVSLGHAGFFAIGAYVSSLMSINLGCSFIISFIAGALITALCGFPSTDYAAHTIMHHLEDYGTIRFQMGYACAIATVLFVMMVGVNLLVQKLIAKVGE